MVNIRAKQELGQRLRSKHFYFFLNKQGPSISLSLHTLHNLEEVAQKKIKKYYSGVKRRKIIQIYS